MKVGLRVELYILLARRLPPSFIIVLAQQLGFKIQVLLYQQLAFVFLSIHQAPSSLNASNRIISNRQSGMDIHSPTVPQQHSTAPHASSGDPKEELLQLMKEKDVVEAKLKALGAVLDSVVAPR
jgi:hypothetical protein